jgi:hypothetical protein
MIAKLTPEQIAKFPDYIREWTGYGLSCEPADRPRAEAAIAMMYAGGGLPAPRIVWCGSPVGNALTCAILKSQDSVGASVRDSAGDSVWASVGACVGASVRDSVWASVWDSVRAIVGASVRDSVWASVWDSVGACVGASVGASVYGQHDASWLAFYKFFHAEVGLVAQTEKLTGLWELCQSAGSVLPYENVCFVSERTSALRFDAQGRLHCETGPALEYPDGWGITAWHGTRIPADWVTGGLTPEIAFAEENAEKRRCAFEILGWARILREMKATIIDADPQIGTLVQVNHKAIGKERFLRCLCGTGREFALPVPPNTKTAKDAQAFIYGEETFTMPEVRT